MLGNGLKVAITTGSMNRLDNLLRALPTWLAMPEADRIVIVDWGSEIPIRSRLNEIDDPRILVAKVTDQSIWHHSKCHNLEIQIAAHLGCDGILRLDNDYLVSPNFFGLHPLEERSFYAVDCHLVAPEIDNKRNLCGTLLARIDNLIQIGGYNERLVHYGYEDEDLYYRLRQSGLQWLHCDLATLDHIPHEDRARLMNSSIDLRRFNDLEKIKHLLIAKNRQLSILKPWSATDRHAQWKFDKVDPHYWKCLEIANQEEK